jgi:Tfp pilus assembly protein PilN
MAKEFCSAIAYSGSSYEWAKLSLNKGQNFSISSSGALGRTPIEPKSFEEDSESTAVADYQKELAFYSKKVSSKLADKNTLSIPTSRLIFKVASFPSTDLSELQQMALNEFEPQSPAPIGEMVFSFDILEISEGSSRIIYAAAKEEDVLNQLLYLDVTPNKVERVDAYILGLLRNLVDTEKLPQEGRSVILAREGDALTIIVADAKLPCAIRHIGAADAISGFALTSAISKTIRQVNSEFTKQNIAKLILVDLENTPVALQLEKIKATIGADEELEAEMLTTSEKPLDNCQALPLTAIGIAKRSFDKGSMNLYPGSWAAELQQQKAKIRNLSIFAAVMVLWVALVAYLYGYPYLITKQIEKTNAQSEQLFPESNAVQDFRNRINIIDRYSDRTHSPLELLREISIYLPEGIDLTQFRFRGTEKILQVEGRAKSSSIIYDFMNNLRKSELLGENRLTSGPTHNKNLGKDVFELAIEISGSTTESNEGGN